VPWSFSLWSVAHRLGRVIMPILFELAQSTDGAGALRRPRQR
jgi:hypothetical protein